MRRRLLDHSRRHHPRRRVAHKPHRNLSLHLHREVNSLHPQGDHLLRFLGGLRHRIHPLLAAPSDSHRRRA